MIPAEGLRYFRRELGLTQTELGRRLGVTQRTISRWETGAEPVGNPHLVLRALADVAAEADPAMRAGRNRRLLRLLGATEG